MEFYRNLIFMLSTLKEDKNLGSGFLVSMFCVSFGWR